MQKVAAYRLEKRDGLGETEVRHAEVKRCEKVLRDWLAFKKAQPADSDSGVYRSEDGSKATYQWERVVDGDRSWQMMRATEDGPTGTRFSASVSITDTGYSVVVYVSLEAGATSTSYIGPILSNPKCPRYVRGLFKLSGDWHHGLSKFTDYEHHGALKGDQAGVWIAREIKAPERTIPIVLVSQLDGTEVFPKLGSEIARDLCGLANVFSLDEDASWALTDELGKGFSCFHGAVRIYWPRFRPDDSRFHHQLWTAVRLGFGEDESVCERFRRQLRGLVMDASALSVLRPREIDEIRAAAGQAALADLRKRASSVSDWENLADHYSRENDRLRGEVERLSEELDTMVVRLESAELVARFQESRKLEIAPIDPNDEIEKHENGPSPGEIRFYKKRDGGHRDRMETIAGCNHNKWQPGNKGDKAKKAIAKLEGRSDWRSIQHCATCTGGGVWKVTW